MAAYDPAGGLPAWAGGAGVAPVRVHSPGRRRLNQLRKLPHLALRPAWWRGALLGVAAAVEHRPLSGLGPLATIVDIGANRGQFALFCASTFKAATIYSFEPLAAPRAVFTSVLGHEPRVRLFDAAIGARRERLPMHVSRRDDNSSLLPITEAQLHYAPGTDEVAVVEVPVAPLGDFLTPAAIVGPALLKVDVQGFELPVLEGCGPLLGRFAWVVVELSFKELYRGQALADEVVAFLQGQGFRMAGFYGNGTQGGVALPVQADFVFARNPA